MPPRIVDSHHHFWQLTAGGSVRYPWLQEAYDPDHFILGAYDALRGDFLPADLRRHWGALPVVATVHVEAECLRADALAETAWLHRLHDTHGAPAAVVAWVDLLADDAQERLTQQCRYPLVRAIRFKPTTRASADATSVTGMPGALDDPRWPRALAQLRDHGLAWDLRVPYWHLEEAAKVLHALPDLPVVVEHTGLPWDRTPQGLAVWRRGLQALAERPRVALRLSEFGLRDRAWDASENRDLVRAAVAIFGAERCMFGSNFPVASLRVDYPSLVAMLDDALAGLSPAQQDAVWCRNAADFYRIRLP